MPETVLVTGGTGYLALWVIATMLEAGYAVRTTVRDLHRAEAVHYAVSRQTPAGDRLEFVEADLLSEDGWAEAVKGCTWVHHVASPQIATRDADVVIRPAVEGTLRVLRAAREGGVRRVVYTSSGAAIYYGHPPQAEPFDESSWTNVEAAPMGNYVKSKALAERAAWDWIADEGGDLEFTTVNPTAIFGPALSPAATRSLSILKRLLEGKIRAIPDLRAMLVDVRDVADLHHRAMSQQAAGERYIATGDGGPVSMTEIAHLLKTELGPAGRMIPTRHAPDFVVRALGRMNIQLGDLVPLLGQGRSASNEKAKRDLGWQPRPWPTTMVDSARSLFALGVVNPV